MIVPGSPVTCLAADRPFHTTKAGEWSDLAQTTLLLDNGLSIRRVMPESDQGSEVWSVLEGGLLAGWLGVRPTRENDERLAAILCGDWDGSAPAGAPDPETSEVATVPWGDMEIDVPSIVLSFVPILARFLVEAHDPGEIDGDMADVLVYMNARFGPPNLGTDPGHPFGHWVLSCGSPEVQILVQPHRLLSLKIRAMVSRRIESNLLRLWDEACLAHTMDASSIEKFAAVAGPLLSSMRRAFLQLMLPVAQRSEPIDFLGATHGWRLDREAPIDEDEETIEPLDPHPLSSMGLPVAFVRRPDLFEELCSLVEEAPDGAQAALERIVSRLREEIDDPSPNGP